MDLTTLDTSTASNEGRWLTLRHPVTGEPLHNDAGVPMRVRLAGVDSRVYRRAMRRLQRRRMEEAAVGVATDVEVLADEAQPLLMGAVTLAWEGVQVDGACPACTPEAATALYARFPFVLDQVLAFVYDRGNFTARGETPSASTPAPSSTPDAG